MRRRAMGFTLAELLIVLAVIALLGAVAYPSYSRQIIKARRIEAQMALVDTMQRQEQFRAQHRSYLAFSAQANTEEARRFKWWLGRDAATSAYEIDGYACAGREIGECIELRARPGTENVDAGFADPECGTLTYSSTGALGASGTSGRCWP